jgi:rhodanese-related sulfurtransferase
MFPQFMSEHPAQRVARSSRSLRLLFEAFIVTVVGVALAFAANQLSPRGLKLTRNYAVDESPAPLANTNGTNTTLESRLEEKNLQLIKRPAVEQLFHDPRLPQNLVLIIDAREEGAYLLGHIPGAYEFSPYYPENYLPTLLPLFSFAEQIIVYCTGGEECPDSQAAALYLRDTVGIPNSKIFVYGGGFDEWEAAGLPTEKGPRNSGDIHEGGK